jgi:hypothetical protein
MWWGQSVFVIDEIGVDGGRLYGRLETSSNAENWTCSVFMKPLQDALDEITSTGGMNYKKARSRSSGFASPT